MASPHLDERTWAELSGLLDEALDLPAAQRQQWLANLGPEHGKLKGHLADLLARADAIETADFLDTLPDMDFRPAAAGAFPGAILGPYRLVRELGTGGMGSVWLAERSDGLMARRLALKFPHSGWNRAGLAERMAREREILATLEHPNIARLYDAGLTSDGEPYLALEYVEGRPIDEYCAARELGVTARLALFAQVARAVAYAHAKLIVHRDLKPANVLVTDTGQVRLLDFGIASLLDDGRAYASALTELSGRVMTPDYASPEQIAGTPITIASDIYSLGVVLYELLAGQRPYKLERTSRGALEDAILEADPRRPSDVVSDRALRKRLRGDLDTIVLTALKKRPDERYPTVNALVDDLERHRSRRPVLARPDTGRYRIAKFVRRNTLAVGASAAVLAAILAGAGVAAWQARVALEEKAQAEAVREFIVSIFRDADPYGQSGRSSTGADLLRRAASRIEDRFEGQPHLKIDLLNIVASGLINLGDVPAAEAALRESIAESTERFGPTHVRTLEGRALLTEVHNARRDRALLEAELTALMPLARAVAGDHPALLVRLLKNQANLAFERGDYADMRIASREALELSLRTLGRDHPLTLAASAILSESYVIGRYPIDVVLGETERALDLALEAYGGGDHPYLIRARERRGRALAVAGHFHEAVAEMRKAIESADAAFGSPNRMAVYAALNVAPYERRLGELTTSLDRSTDALEALAEWIEPDTADYAFALTSRGVTWLAARRPEEAVEDLGRAQEIYRGIFGAGHWDTLTARFNRAVALAYLGRFADAEAALAAAADPSVTIVNRKWLLHVTGIVARLRGDLDRAVASQRESLTLIENGPRADWDRLRTFAALGLALSDRGDAGAARVLRRAHDLFATLKVKMNPAHAEVLAALGRERLGRGAAEEALPLLTAAHDFWRTFAPDNRGAGRAALWLGLCHRSLGREAQAAALLGRAANILESSPIPSDTALVTLAR